MHKLKKRMIVSAAMLVVTSLMSIMTAAQASATGYCGSVCNGKSPLVAVNGVRCADTAVLFQSGHPATLTNAQFDTAMDVYAYHSDACKTMWFAITARSNNRPDCTYSLERFEFRNLVYQLRNVQGCPAPGATTVTPMVDDHRVEVHTDPADIALVEQASVTLHGTPRQCQYWAQHVQTN